jgi:hypothetical protein
MYYEYIIYDQIELHGSTEIKTYEAIKECSPLATDLSIFESIEEYINKKQNHKPCREWVEFRKRMSSPAPQEEKVKMKYFLLNERTKIYTDKPSTMKIEVFTKKYYNWLLKATEGQKNSLYNHMLKENSDIPESETQKRCSELLTNNFFYNRYESYDSYIESVVQMGLAKAKQALGDFVNPDYAPRNMPSVPDKISFSDSESVQFYEFSKLYENNSRLKKLLSMNQPQIVLEYPVYVYNQFKNSEKTTSERREVIDKLWELFYKRNLDNELTERWLKEENESKLEYLEEIREDLYKKRLVREDIYERHMRLPGSGFIK